MIPRGSDSTRCFVLAAIASMLGIFTPMASRAAEPVDAKVFRSFLEQHCLDCHNADNAKGCLRLDTLTPEFASVEEFRTWTKVLDRVSTGEMPPKKSPRPTKAEQELFLTQLHEQLLAADHSFQPPPGSLTLRRMNRSQYENTIRDLLAIDVDLQDRLPADSRAFGFDNIGSALSLSSAQLEAYLEAADTALDAAIVRRPRPEGIKKRTNGMTAVGSDFHVRQEGTVLELEEAAVRFGKHYFYACRDSTPEDGNYRIRASLYGYQTAGKPVTVYVYSILKSGNRTIGYYDIPPDVPQVLDITCRLLKGTHVAISPVGFKYATRMRNAADQTDPGLAVQWVEMEGPLFDSWPPPGHKRLFGDLPMVPNTKKGDVLAVQSKDPKADAERLLGGFMRQAYRRPVTRSEMEPILNLVAQHLERQHTFEESMRVGYKAMLCSPDFLYFQEKRGHADEFALASRLSYFLWNTMPDSELMDLAERGSLSKPETLHAQVERMLKHAKAKNFTQNFLAQWLDLRNIDATTPDRKIYPEFDTALQEAFVAETQLFFEDVLKNDRSLTNFVASDYTFANERLATHYGIEGVNGPTMRRVALPPNLHRGGVLTMGSVLKVTANGSYTHPVHRGVWMLRNILGKPPEPPPPNAGAIEPDLRGAKTIREQLDIHRKATACASCHVKIDPLGFALESFDVTGMWRDKYRVLTGPMLTLSKNGPAVEASYTMPDGRPFRDIDELKQILLEDKDQLARGLAEKLLIYSMGRGLRYSDRAVVNDVVAKCREKNYGFRSLIHEVVASKAFRQP